MKITHQIEAFTGQGIKPNQFHLDGQDVLVYDAAAQYFTRCHCLSAEEIETIRRLLNGKWLRSIVDANAGFITSGQLEWLATAHPNRQLLVRCGACRFLIAADSAKHMVDIIRAEGRDYVRDVSLPSTDAAYQPQGEQRYQLRSADHYETDALGQCYSDADPGL